LKILNYDIAHVHAHPKILMSVIFSGWTVHLILGANGKVLNVERREGGGRGGRGRGRVGEEGREG
jgi:hypothetical protein